MFCTNCGNKLPEGSKFCPSCGARILTEIVEPLTQTVETAADSVDELAEKAAEETKEAFENAGIPYPETAEELTETAADAAEDAAGEIAEMYEETAETVEETVETAADEAAETADAIVDAVEETAGEAAEAAGAVIDAGAEAAAAAGELFDEAADTAEAAAEEVTEAAEDVADAAEETLEDASEAAEEAVEEATEAAEETVDAAFETVEDAAVAADEAVDAVVETAEDAVSAGAEAARGFTSDVEAVLTVPVTDILPETEYASADSAEPVPDTAVPEASPYTAQTVPVVDNTPPKKKRTGLKVLIALLLIAALAVGGYFIYQNLPAQKVKRFKEAATEAITAGDLVEASVQYKNALDIDPADEESISALLMMHDMVKQDAVDAAQLGLYEEAVEQMKVANSILVATEEKNLQDLADIYYDWVGVLAYGGEEDKANTVLASAKADGLSAESISLIEENLKRFAGLHRTEAHLDEVSRTLVGLNGEKNYAEIFRIIEGEAADLAAYHETYGGSYPIVSIYENGKAVIWNFNMDRDAIQAYIGDISSDAVQNGVGDTYYKKGVFKDSVEYEFFSSEWKNGVPNGQFTEITFNGEPDVPSDENSSTVTGTVKDGHYDGDLQNRRGGKVFNMKFDNGKVIVLDTVDPNGEESNVVGYTEDKNTWIYWNDASRLEGTYGLRYIN